MLRSDPSLNSSGQMPWRAMSPDSENASLQEAGISRGNKTHRMTRLTLTHLLIVALDLRRFGANLNTHNEAVNLARFVKLTLM